MPTGPSSSASPYLVRSSTLVGFTSIITSGDAVAGSTNPDGSPWNFVGIPDGIGVLDDADVGGADLIRVFVNHELGSNLGIVRDHGSIGSFVSELVLDKDTLQVVAADDLAETLYVDPQGDGTYQLATPVTAPAPTPVIGGGNIGRLCSGDLAAPSAYFDSGSGLGTQDRIYLTGEEIGAEGRAFAFVATGAEAGTAWELPALGKFSWENAVASPTESTRTVVVGLDDATPGQVYVYVGDKQATGNTIERAGLVGGELYGIAAAGIGNNLLSEFALNGNVPLSGNFTLEAIAGAETLTGAQTELASDAAGVSEFWRPEDGAWDPSNGNRFYFVTTANATGPSRLWALDFADVTDPTAGGTFTALLDGSEGQVMFDNMTVTQDGIVVLQEDPGNNPRLARVWAYDPGADRLYQVGRHDPARFLEAGSPNAQGFTQDEESSGVVDVTELFGDEDTYAFMLDVQAHGPFPDPALQPEVVEQGQLLLMTVERSLFANLDSELTTGDAAAGDSLDGGTGNDTLEGLGGADNLYGGRDNDLLLGGEGRDTLGGATGGDTLIGGLGADFLSGGAGRDFIRYGSAAEGGDFVRWESIDQVEVSAAGFGGGLTAGLNIGASGRFESAAAGGTAPTATTADGTGTFLLDTDTNRLFYDADGSGTDAAVLLATFTGPALTSADITVIA